MSLSERKSADAGPWTLRGQGLGLWPKVIKGPGFEDEEEIEVVRADACQGAVEALESLRAAWNEHMATCPQHAKLPSFEEIRAWMDAPSDTASGGQ